MRAPLMRTSLAWLQKRLAHLAVGAGLAIVVITPAHAAVDMFVRADNIPGESIDKQHPGEIEISSYSLAASRNGPSGAVAFDELLFTHLYDKSSPLLFDSNVHGTHIGNVVLSFRKAGGATPLDYLIITLADVVVTSIHQTDASGADRGVETVGLRFGKITMKYTTQKADGAAGAVFQVVYDQQTGQAT